ncbi:MAG: tetratricopeptide repeat protein, partial [Verrucomicrobiota bacterium]|nr:tetratricopeptide repeat protein [Verrucomicrobiota bacterium]
MISLAQKAVLVWLAALLVARPILAARRPKPSPPARRAEAILDDSTVLRPARDLILKPEGEHQAEALARFVEGANFEDDGEMESALAAYRGALNLDPGEVELAVRVATMLSRNDNYPDAIDVLKDAVKAKPNAPQPYLQLAFIYAKYPRKMEQAVAYADKAIALDPKNIDGYQRLFEIDLAAGNESRARATLQRAAGIETDDATFWLKLGRLFTTLLVRPEAKPDPAQLAQINEFYHKAAAKGQDNANVLKEAADFFGATDQVKEALPLYLRVLELQPDDASVRQKVAAAFVATNQRAKAIATLEAIIKEHPERYQSYELLAQLHDDEGRALASDKKEEAAREEFRKAAQNYEQCLLINPSRGVIILRLAELMLGALQQSDRAVALLADARRSFPNAPEFAYYYAIALRESKKPKEAVVVFQEALNEAVNADSQFLNARFYLDYGAAAEE